MQASLAKYTKMDQKQVSRAVGQLIERKIVYQTKCRRLFWADSMTFIEEDLDLIATFLMKAKKEPVNNLEFKQLGDRILLISNEIQNSLQ